VPAGPTAVDMVEQISAMLNLDLRPSGLLNGGEQNWAQLAQAPDGRLLRW